MSICGAEEEVLIREEKEVVLYGNWEAHICRGKEKGQGKRARGKGIWGIWQKADPSFAFLRVRLLQGILAFM